MDPLSSSEKDAQKRMMQMQVAARDELIALKQETGGLTIGDDPEQLPETLEEAEIFFETTSRPTPKSPRRLRRT